MPASKSHTQRSIMVVASSTSATTQSTEKVGKKVDSNEGKKQEKKEKSAEKPKENETKKTSGEKATEKAGEMDKKVNKLEKQTTAKTEPTQMELLEKKANDEKKEAETQPKLVYYNQSTSAKSWKGSPTLSERGTQNTLALLAAAEKIAGEKGDYDSFGPPGGKPTKKK
ncbi:hypothetical protein COOONC_24206 [Cooperia oncophora]